jgi:transcriptional/translational regulatory protein YebC/TACO1
MIICETLTSNVNRTISNIRTIFHKNGGNIGAEGSVGYMFDNTGVIVFAGDDADEIFEYLIEQELTSVMFLRKKVKLLFIQSLQIYIKQLLL